MTTIVTTATEGGVMHDVLPDPKGAPEDHLEPVTFAVAGDNIVLEFEHPEGERTSAGGVIIPGTETKTRSSQAVIVGAGPHARVQVMPTDGFERERAYVDETTIPWTALSVGTRLIVHRHKLVRLELDADDERELFVCKPDVVIGVLPD